MIAPRPGDCVCTMRSHPREAGATHELIQGSAPRRSAALPEVRGDPAGGLDNEERRRRLCPGDGQDETWRGGSVERARMHDGLTKWAIRRAVFGWCVLMGRSVCYSRGKCD